MHDNGKVDMVDTEKLSELFNVLKEEKEAAEAAKKKKVE